MNKQKYYKFLLKDIIILFGFFWIMVIIAFSLVYGLTIEDKIIQSRYEKYWKWRESIKESENDSICSCNRIESIDENK